MNRTDRLVAMVLHLQGRRVVRAEELARHFDINVRTVYRDIAALGEAGVPISGEAGVGYSLRRGYQLPPVMFTADEASALFVGGELVKQFTDASLHAPMASALDKLRAVLPRDRQDHVERLAQRTLVVGRTGSVAPEAAGQRWLLPVQQGVVRRRVLRLGYRGRERAEETARDVEPLGVVFYGGSWYLVAWCRLRQDYRHFRVDRIRRLEVTPEPFEPREGFSLERHMEESSRREQALPVQVWFHDAVLERARSESYATLIEGRSRDGGAEFSLYTWSLEWTARWLLSFGAGAEAVGPAKLRALVRAEAEQVAGRYR
ncbi:MAG: YafY family transcriptional regulator [Opitutaceae bacterium]|nr:YafY family transcriptional regulator [Opitutaceae bacterium]